MKTLRDFLAIFLAANLAATSLLYAARNIANAATGNIAFGNSATHRLLGDMSLGIWVKFGSGFPTAGGAIVTREGGVGETEADNSCIFVYALGTSGAWDIAYIHENAAGTNNANTWDMNLANATWTYIGISRDATANTVILYTGTGGGAIATQTTYNYAADATGCNAGTEGLWLGIRSDGSTSQADDFTFANFTLWNRVLAVGEHQSLMHNSIPEQTGIVALSPIIGASPEPDWSGNAFNGTVTGTTVADHAPARSLHQ